MAIDEFGREIPGARGGSPSRQLSSNGNESPLNRNENDDNDRDMSRYGDRSHDHDNMHMHRSRSRSQSADYMSSSNRDGPGSRGRSPPQRYNDKHHHHHHHHRRSNSPSIMRRNRNGSRGRSRSFSPDRDYNSGPRDGFPRGGYGHGHHRRQRYPAEQYVDDPMLSEFLWREMHEKKGVDTHMKDDEDDEKKEGSEKDPTTNSVSNESNVDTETNKSNNEDFQTIDDKPETQNNEMEVEIDENTAHGSETKTYDQYRKQYCTEYIRNFFNAHLDDEWFKERYSPYHRKNFAAQMRNRAHAEANNIKEEIMKPDEKNTRNGAEIFISEARLGIGKKPTGDANKKQRYGKKRSYSAVMEDEMKSNNNNYNDNNNTIEDPLENDLSFRNPVPSSHILSGHAHCALEITDVPPYVTDAQLSHAIAEHSSSPPLRICTTTVGTAGSEGSLSSGRNTQKYCNSLLKTVWAIFINEEAKEEMVENLSKANFEANRISDRNRSMEIDIIPSIDAPKNNKILELDIDCSDAYGRTEIDADGHGGAPASNPSDQDDMSRGNPNSNKDRTSSVPKVRTRKVTVYVKTDSQPDRQNISVLSAALSSKERIPRDKTAALMIARALDTANAIPSGVQLDDLVEIIFPNGTHEKDDTEEDVLDVAIAYLRRVHLFSFYNGLSSRCEGDVLSGYFPAGTIYLRLRDADTILQKAKDESVGRNLQKDAMEANSTGNNADDKSTPKTDLLVQRLDEAIANALEDSTARIGTDHVMVSETVDAEAVEIEKKELDMKQQWLDDHALLDADGRARCSFHFCRKLFKDKTFLFKHLLKKHPEYLLGEQAKIHDPYMMKAWEEEEVRPLPQILVDCGDRLGLVPVAVTGICPIAEDPAPELFKKEEEKRARREERERRERFQRPAPKYEADRHKGQPNTGNNSGGFVDIDDLQDKKVELSFENIALPLPPPKKKKKKKKKIL